MSCKMWSVLPVQESEDLPVEQRKHFTFAFACHTPDASHLDKDGFKHELVLLDGHGFVWAWWLHLYHLLSVPAPSRSNNIALRHHLDMGSTFAPSHLPDFRGWKLYHDGDGVAIMHGPEIVAAKDGPNAVLVYDAMMLADDPADNDKLNWRTIFSGQFIMRDMPEHPVVHLSGLHIYAGREVQERKASVTVSQKKRIAFESMLRSFKEDPSIVAGLEQGKCMQVFMGDWNLNEPQMKAVLELVLADVQEKSWRFQARIDPHSQIVYDLQSSMLRSFKEDPSIFAGLQADDSSTNFQQFCQHETSPGLLPSNIPESAPSSNRGLRCYSIHSTVQ